uniref:Uncharacterized protein n=1 Tax=Syphacia muris TaxID=451379 RepID=A0A0N5AI70_9BILA
MNRRHRREIDGYMDGWIYGWMDGWMGRGQLNKQKQHRHNAINELLTAAAVGELSVSVVSESVSFDQYGLQLYSEYLVPHCSTTCKYQSVYVSNVNFWMP